MKQFHTMGLCVVLLMHSIANAQESPLPIHQSTAEKPSLFSALPSEFECSSNALDKIIGAALNEQINVQLSSQFQIQGVIVDKSQQNAATFSVNTRLTNYHNALFNLSVRLQPDNSIRIQGRIIHPRYGDVLILSKERDKYYFKKQLQKLYMPE